METFAGFKDKFRLLDLLFADKLGKKEIRPEVITSSTVTVPKNQRWKLDETKGLQRNYCSKYDYDDETKTKQEKIGS